MAVGIEAINIFCGCTTLDLNILADHRQLDRTRFENLLVKEKTVALAYEDPVTYAVNAAGPLLKALSDADKHKIELLITCTESGIDFGKSLSTYVHQYLSLNRRCRLFEIKQACYSGTAGLQTAVNFILSNASPGAKALVIATDISRIKMPDNTDILPDGWAFAEPSGGAGAVAMLVGADAEVFQLDVGASGYYGYEVMDTCRPIPDAEVGDSDLALLSYLDCCEASFKEYSAKVADVNYKSTFDYLSFHTPFGGMVKGAHRMLMRKIARASAKEIEADFKQRVEPGLHYCQRVGNIMGGTVFLALASTVNYGDFSTPRRVGIFSYGSGCCSEFYSGIVTPAGQKLVQETVGARELSLRYKLNISQYESLIREAAPVQFGTRNVDMDWSFLAEARPRKGLLFLRRVHEYHRDYEWAE